MIDIRFTLLRNERPNEYNDIEHVHVAWPAVPPVGSEVALTLDQDEVSLRRYYVWSVTYTAVPVAVYGFVFVCGQTAKPGALLVEIEARPYRMPEP